MLYKMVLTFEFVVCGNVWRNLYVYVRILSCKKASSNLAPRERRETLGTRIDPSLD